MATVLVINSALPYTEIALIKGEKTLYYEGWESDYDEAEKLLPKLKEAIKSAMVVKKTGGKESGPEIDKVFVVKGPGGFTGLRVGITIANTFAYVQKVKMETCNTFDFLEAKIPQNFKKNTALVLRAGGKNIAVKLPDSGKREFMTMERLSGFLGEKTKIKYLTGDIKKENRPENYKWLELKELMPMDKALKTILSDKSKTFRQIKPFYLSPPQITKSKKKIFT